MTDSQDFLRSAAVFAESVRRELRHLAAEDVANLTDGIESDIAASLSDGGTLPSVTEYAADLLRGAGIEVPESDPKGKAKNVIVSLEVLVLKWWTAIRVFSTGLAPAWWVVRAWIVAELIGSVVSETNMPLTLISQWGEMPVGGVFVLLLSLYFSIRIGRRQDGGKRNLLLIANLALVVVGVGLGITQASAGTSWGEYSPYLYGQQPPEFMSNGDPTCPMVEIPIVTGLTVSNAQIILNFEGFSYAYFDSQTNTPIELSQILETGIVSQQVPDRPMFSCIGTEKVALYFDEISILPTTTTTTTTILSDINTATTGVIQSTTTAIPMKISTTTVPMRTTTTDATEVRPLG